MRDRAMRLSRVVQQQALDNDAVLLHDDEDYERIAGVRKLRTMRD